MAGTTRTRVALSGGYHRYGHLSEAQQHFQAFGCLLSSLSPWDRRRKGLVGWMGSPFLRRASVLCVGHTFGRLRRVSWWASVTALRVTRKEVGSSWLGSIVRGRVLKMALPHALPHLSPEMSVGGEGMDHAEGFAEEQLEEGGVDRFIIAVMGQGEDWHCSPSVTAGLKRSQPLTDPSDQAPDRRVLG